MFVLEEPHSARLASDLASAIAAGESAERCASILCAHAGGDLVSGIVNFALHRCVSSIKEGVRFRDGLVNLANGPAFCLDLRYAFDAGGEAMLPAGRGDRVLVRAADAIIANIGPGAIRYSSFALAEGLFESLSADAVLTPGPGGTIEPRASLIVRGGRDVVSLQDVSRARFLSLTFLPTSPLDWLFSRSTLRPVAKSVAHVDDSLLVTCLEIAAWLGDPVSRVWVEALTDHPAHFVRWKAVQALGAVDREAALVRVRAATNDPHPGVRNAALATLAAAHEAC